MTVVFQPCRCLWRASVQITRTTRSRRMILQLRQIFFTEARTFIIVLQIQDAARRRRSINGSTQRDQPCPLKLLFFSRLSY